MTKKVTVCNKYPHGLVLVVADTAVEIKGANAPGAISGYGLTEVDEDFWEAWVQTHGDWPMVKNEIVFAQKKLADAKAAAEDHADVKTGVEPLSQVVVGKDGVPVLEPSDQS